MTFSTNLEVIDLMDELQRTDAIARRLALAFTICCTTTSGLAAEADTKSPQATSLGQLLSQGWNSQLPLPLPPADIIDSPRDQSVRQWPDAVRREPSDDVRGSIRLPLIGSSQINKADRQAATTKQDPPSRRSMSLAELIRNRQQSKSVTKQEGLPLKSGATPQQTPGVFTPAPVRPKNELVHRNAAIRPLAPVEKQQEGDRLADYLRAQRSPDAVVHQPSETTKVQPSRKGPAENAFVAPARTPLPTHDEIASRQEADQPIVEAATKITPPSPARTATVLRRPGVTYPGVTPPGAIESPAPARPKAPVPTIATVPPRITSVSKRPIEAGPKQHEETLQDAAVAQESVPEEFAGHDSSGGLAGSLADVSPPVLPSIPQADDRVAVEGSTDQTDPLVGRRHATSPQPELPQTESLAVRELSELPLPLIDQEPGSNLSEVTRLPERYSDMIHADPRLLPVPSLENIEAFLPPLPPPTPSITMHTTRLQELAQHSLVKSQQSLQRGATHTARKYAIEAVQAVVSMRDAQEGGNRHSQQLNRAFDAIRESKDFCGEFGFVDSTTLRRMVDVHETSVLKQEDLSLVSTLEATEAYLEQAKSQLVLAVGDVHEGSQALALLGQIEFFIADPVDTYSTSVAVAIQRAAVEADPYFAAGYRVLGATLLGLGLTEEAADCLVQSLRIQPNRLAYERLLEVARKLGDVDTARICTQALKDPRMDEGILVHTLTPQQFAATHRPMPKTINEPQSSSKAERAKVPAKSGTRVGFRSIFPFNRR